MSNNQNSLGKHLKRVRKELGFKQHEITGGEITRNLISLIENNKTPLNEKTAKILAENMNKLLRKSNINMIIDPEDLLNPERYYAKKKVDQYINQFESAASDRDKEEKIKEIETFLINWDIPDKKTVAFGKIGDYYYSQKEFYKAYIYFIKAFENSIKISRPTVICTLILKITRCCLKLEKYDEAIHYSKIVLIYEEIIPEDLLSKILFNTALTYYHLELYSHSIDIIRKVEDKLNRIDGQKLFDLLTLKAICYKEMEEYEKGLNIHEKILTIIDDNLIEKKIIVLVNILNTLYGMNDKERVSECLNTILEFLNKLPSTNVYLCQIYYEIGCAYKFLDRYNEAEEYFEKSLEYAERKNNLTIQAKATLNLIDIYKMSNNKKKIDVLKEKVFGLVKKNLIQTNDNIIFKLILCYNQLGCIEKSNEIINFILNNKN
ncbi:hypothetical protein [Thermohalobacter berrensis]|uniref:Uncharacterized protein n=1 Tax=Thermohalobacter berrensis TaxID=99594 RepID=A0A419T2I6_9FIRM|nr:hypothetical protein [Thermohalobacter berrensis]RKD31651.1 hypothetical protein BET03_12175 [Thermohalobacter berrensis]